MANEMEIEKPIILIPGEEEVIKEVLKRKNAVQKARSAFEKQWLVNIAFLYGKHYFAVEKRPLAGLDERIYWELKNIERKKKTRRIANYILPLYRSLLARMLLMKAKISVEPLTRSTRDVESAKVAQEVLEDFWINVNKSNPVLAQEYAGMLQILAKLFSYMLTLGRGYLKPYFNPTASAKVMLGDTINEFQVGAVETEVIHLFDLFVDPMKQWIIQQKILSVDTIKDLYDVEIEPENIGMTDVEKQLMSLLETGQSMEEKYENAVRVYEMWQVPDTKYPEGRLVITTEKKQIFESILPEEYKGKLPFFKFDYLDVMMSGYPQGMVEQLISLQEEYNFTISRLAEYKKWFAGKLKVPKNCKLETRYDDEVGQIIRYDAAFGEPHFETPPNPPNFLIEEIERIRRDMEDISAVHDTSMGRIPSQAKSGIAIENLSELDNSQLSPVLMGIEQQLAFFCETVLDIVEKRYTEPRLIGITGEEMAQEVKTFRGEQVKGNRRISISLGSSLPTSRKARQEQIMLLAERGYISREKALELMEFGDVEGVFHSIDESQAKTENRQMLQGIIHQPEQWENHTIHAKVHTDFMKSEQFRNLPLEIQDIFRQHYALHQQFISAEMQAAKQM